MLTLQTTAEGRISVAGRLDAAQAAAHEAALATLDNGAGI